MKYIVAIMLVVVCVETTAAQISLIGGVNVNFREFNPRKNMLYFGGVEIKPFQLRENYKLYAAPQYTALVDYDRRMNMVMVPVGISYQFNEMWDEKTNLFRVIDLNLGGYGGYVFNVMHNNENITDTFRSFDYGLQLSLKMRLFVFYPLYLSYIHGLADLDKGDLEVSQYMLQLGAYFPISTILRDY